MRHPFTSDFWTDALPDFLGRTWQWCVDLWALLRVSRFALAGLLGYGAFILATAQGREGALLFADDPALHYLLTLFFAVNVWLWARLMVSYRYLPVDRVTVDTEQLAADIARFREGDRVEDQPSNRLVDKYKRLEAINARLRAPEATRRAAVRMAEIPRILGALVFVLAGASLALAAVRFGASEGPLWASVLNIGAAVMLISAPLFYLLARYRRALVMCFILAFLRPDWRNDYSAADPRRRCAELLGPRHGNREPGRVRRWLANAFRTESRDDMQRRWRWYAWAELRANTRAWLLGFTTLLIGAFAWALAAPNPFGSALGPLGVLITLLAFWMMTGTWIVYWLDHRRFPVFIAAFLLGMTLSLWFDHHAVRTADAAAAAPSARPTVAIAARAWKDGLGASEGPGTGAAISAGPVTPVIVATAGGGIRAAYWTALVLEALHRDPRFHRNLFAVSAVSGGGLGAAAYLAAVGEKGLICDEIPAEGATSALRQFLSQDFLAPTVAAFLGRDSLYGFLPVYRIPDRAQALETAWEKAWHEACAGVQRTRFAEPFLSALDMLPALIINGTLVHTGKRILTSPFQVSPKHFHDAHDLYDFIGDRDVPLSTAVHNGARFTYVSPAGTLRRGSQQDGSKPIATGQIIDGGYFENYGAETAAELLAELCRALACNNQGAAGKTRPVVIQISSDPGLGETAEATATPATALTALTHHSQTYAPLAGLQNTRGARGINAMKRLRAMTKRHGGTFVHLRLCRFPDREQPPLGWALSRAARETLESHLERACTDPLPHDNKAQLARVLTALAGKPPARRQTSHKGLP